MIKPMLSEAPYSIVNSSIISHTDESPAPRAEDSPPILKRDSRIALELIGISPPVQLLRESVQKAADHNRPVLIYGEPGTGKSFAARIIHVASRRAWKPLIALDCSVLSAEAFQQALFGNDGIRFSSSASKFCRSGILQQADGGTLLLENIDYLAMPLQKEVRRSLLARHEEPTEPCKRSSPDVRILITIQAESLDQVRKGRLHDGLLQELSFQTITTSPLRERMEDLGLFSEHFLNQYAVREGRLPRRISLTALELLESYHWPGNLHELQNVIERSCQLDFEPKLTAEMIHPWLADQRINAPTEVLGMTLKEMERKLIETTFTRCHGNRERTAEMLKIGLRTLSGKLREYGYPPRGGPGSNRDITQQKAA